ncbi:methyltransferase [Chromatiaceae bacterium AAb-1]|nr:methyltransferase [Chromatiaceae bacterium AAb-1]
MSSGFQCKQFYIAHDQCAMKVSTDALLLGAWVQLPASGNLLDIGAGSGIISLMLAQRCAGKLPVVAVELDSSAAAQAAVNVQQSPWPDAIRVIKGDILTHQCAEGYSLIVSNPPFFQQRLAAVDPLRHQARHNDSLPFAALLQQARHLLRPGGRFELILPVAEAEIFTVLAQQQGWFLYRYDEVFTTPDKAAGRILMSWQRESADTQTGQLQIRQADGAYTTQYRRLLRDFYLKF